MKGELLSGGKSTMLCSHVATSGGFDLKAMNNTLLKYFVLGHRAMPWDGGFR